MAPKGKRSAAGAAASPKKKSRVDPIYAGIIGTLQESDDLSEHCREMLVAMAVPCLSTFKSDRHKLQTAGVEMIEENLEEHKKKLTETVETAKAEIAKLEGSKNSLQQNLETAKTTLEEKKSAFLSAHNAHQEANVALRAATTDLAAAKDAQKKGDAKFAELQKEKTALNDVFVEHFKTPMDANEGPHYNQLKKFVVSLGLEDSLTSALPSSCAKAKDARGGFDDLVLTELGKALEKKIESLTNSINEEEAGVATRQAAIESAETALEAKVSAERACMHEMETASTAQQDAVAVVKTATEEWETFEPRLKAATDNHSMHDAIRVDFEERILRDFMNLRDKEAPVAAPVEEEAAPAGA